MRNRSYIMRSIAGRLRRAVIVSIYHQAPDIVELSVRYVTIAGLSGQAFQSQSYFI